MKRRGVALLGLAMIAAGGIWAAVAWASTSIEIEGPRGTSKTINVEDLNTDVENKNYRVGDDFQTITGYSVKQILQALGISDSEWLTITIEDITVRNGQFRDRKPAVFYVSENDDDKLVFLRPKSAAGPAVTDSADGGANFDISYRVPLQIDPAEVDPDAGETIEFTATVPGGGAQNAYTFEWDAGTAGSGTGRIFEVTYPNTDGQVKVSVRASRAGTDVGVVTVGAKIDAPENTGGSGSGSFGSGSFGSGGFDSGYTPPSDFGGDFGGSDFGGSNPDPNFPDPPDDTPEDSAIPEETSGVSVSGELLSQISALEDGNGEEGLAGEEDAAEEDAAEPPRDEATFEKNEEVTAPGVLIAAGVVVGLIGLGAGREIEDVRPRRFLRRPDLSGLRRLLPPWK